MGDYNGIVNRFWGIASKALLLLSILGLVRGMVASEARGQLSVKSAILTMQADDEFWVFLNGNLVHETETIRGTQWNKPQVDLEVDPKWFKPCGENVLGVYFYDIPGGKTFLIYKLKIKLSDGSTTTLYSDGDEKILDVGTVYDAKEKGDKVWSDLGREGVAYPAREPRLPALWNTRGDDFDDSAWEGTGRCYFENSALRQDPFFEIGRFRGDFVPAIRPNVVGKDCDVAEPGGTYLVRDLFEINPCPNAKPKPVCPGWFINAGSGFHFIDRKDNKWVADQIYGKDGHTYGRLVPKGKDPQMGRRTGDVLNTQEDNVYHTFAQSNKKSIKYKFDLEPGPYTVTLRFMEPKSRSRILNVTAEGLPALENFNPFESADNNFMSAVDKSFSIEVTDSSLDIEIVGAKGKAIVSGVSVTCGATQALVQAKQKPTSLPPVLPPPIPTPTPPALRVAPPPPPVLPTSTPRPLLPTPTIVFLPTKTRTPTPTPDLIQKIDVPWKILSLYYNFKGVIRGKMEIRINSFRKITLTKLTAKEGRGEVSPQFKAHVILVDNQEFDLQRFVRINPRTGEEHRNIVFMRGPHPLGWDFADIIEIEVIEGLDAFDKRRGKAVLKITLRDGTIHEAEKERR